GNVGIGTPSPGVQLDLSTDSARKLSTTTWATGSDIRLKKDIRPFTDGLNIISRINPVWFKWNGRAGYPDDGKDNIGVIGQEIEKVAPYTVTRTKAKLEPTDKKETELIDFTSHALIFALINAVKEQQKQIEQLEARLVVLEKRQ
ncbi:MAG: tail fiber domain-containing protein, partial [Deltaproteobacteria bacterium]